MAPVRYHGHNTSVSNASYEVSSGTRPAEAALREYWDLSPLVVGLGGLEPPTSSLSAIEGSPLCNPAFSQVAADRRGRSNALFERVAEGWLRSARRFSRRGSHHSRNQTVLALKMSPDLHRTLIQLSLRCTPLTRPPEISPLDLAPIA